jgi:hypothetical protein
MGEDTLEDNFMESFRKEEGRRRRSPMVTCEGERERFCWGENRMRRKKKGAGRPNQYSKQDASLASYYDTRAPARMAPSYPPWRGRLPRAHPRAPP